MLTPYQAQEFQSKVRKAKHARVQSAALRRHYFQKELKKAVEEGLIRKDDVLFKYHKKSDSEHTETAPIVATSNFLAEPSNISQEQTKIEFKKDIDKKESKGPNQDSRSNHEKQRSANAFSKILNWHQIRKEKREKEIKEKQIKVQNDLKNKENALSRRKHKKSLMTSKTKRGQPLMANRMSNLLEKIRQNQ